MKSVLLKIGGLCLGDKYSPTLVRIAPIPVYVSSVTFFSLSGIHLALKI